MKKCFLGLLGILLLGGVVTAQADILEDVGFTVGDMIRFPKTIMVSMCSSRMGIRTTEYGIDFSKKHHPI